MSALAPLGSVMKPKPFLLLNHLIIPWGMQTGLVLTRYSAPAGVYGGRIADRQLHIGNPGPADHDPGYLDRGLGAPRACFTVAPSN
jgi:hypothetical protein